MNCCKNSKNNKHMHPMWMMVLCCGAPLLLLLVISLLGTNFSGIKFFLIGAIPFICPIMMLIMMPMMFMKNKGSGDCHEQTSAENTDNETNSNGNQLK